MGRPSKTVDVLKDEKKSHRTKAELEKRKASEAAQLTGIKMHESAEVKNDPVAHKEFTRVKKLLSTVGKNDALYESVMNDYAMLKSDIVRYTEMRQKIQETVDDAADAFALMLKCDAQIEKARKKRFDIEKENGMTIAAAMRSIPKTVSKTENPLLAALQDDD